VLALLALSLRLPVLFAAAILAPQLLYPQGLRAAGA
jgi:hypothetical protein